MSNILYTKKTDLNDLYKKYSINYFNFSNKLEEIAHQNEKEWPQSPRSEINENVKNNEWVDFFVNDSKYYDTSKVFNSNSIILSNISDKTNQLKNINFYNDYILYYNHNTGLRKMTSLVDFTNGLMYDIINHKIFYNIEDNYIKEVNKKLYFNDKSFEISDDSIYGIAKVNKDWFNINTGDISIHNNILKDIRDIKNILYSKNKSLIGIYEYVKFINDYESRNNRTNSEQNIEIKQVFDPETNILYDIDETIRNVYIDSFYLPVTKIFYKNNYWYNLFHDNNNLLSSNDLSRTLEVPHNNIVYVKNLKDIEFIVHNEDKYYNTLNDKNKIHQNIINQFTGNINSIINFNNFNYNGIDKADIYNHMKYMIDYKSDKSIINANEEGPEGPSIIFGAGEGAVAPGIGGNIHGGETGIDVTPASQANYSIGNDILSEDFKLSYFGQIKNEMEELEIPDNLFFTYLYCDADNSLNKFMPNIKKSKNYTVKKITKINNHNTYVYSYFSLNYINGITDKPLFEKNGITLNTQYNIDNLSYTLINYNLNVENTTITCKFEKQKYKIHIDNQNKQDIKVLYDFRDINKLFYNEKNLNTSFDYFCFALNYDDGFLSKTYIDELKFDILKQNNLLFENNYNKVLLGCKSETIDNITSYTNFHALYNDFNTKIIKDISFNPIIFNKDDDIIDINDLDLSEPVKIYIYEIKEVYKIKNSETKWTLYDKNHISAENNVIEDINRSKLIEFNFNKKYYVLRNSINNPSETNIPYITIK